MTSRFVWSLLVMAIALPAACAPAPATGAVPPVATTQPAPGVQPTAGQVGAALLTVVSPDGKSTPFTLEALKALPQSKVEVEGKPEDGPALPEILKAAGIADFRQVTLTGDVMVTLTKDQVTADVILDFTNRGTVKLAATRMPKDQWVKDITKIETR